jgi:hypothetical protein
VGHHAHHIAALIDDAGNVARRPVRVVAITEDNAPFILEFIQRLFIGRVAAIAMRDWDRGLPALAIGARERRVGVDDVQLNFLADEFEPFILQQRTRQETRLRQDLKAVAHAEHKAAAFGMRDHRLHYRAPRRHRAGAEIVAVRETARQQHEVGSIRQFGILVPDHAGGLAGDALQRPCGVAVAV